MNNTRRYLPHDINTKYHAVQLYISTKDIQYVCRKYHVSYSSLHRWIQKYDGTKQSLLDKSHRPHGAHPKSHTEEELTWIRNLYRRNPGITMCELYGKLRADKGYARHPGSLYRVCRRLGLLQKPQSAKKKEYKPKPYDTPSTIGIKWQMDVKYVPVACYVGKDPQRFYQYTLIDEASRERFIYPYMENSTYSTLDFVKRAIVYFGYAPEIIQTDNGTEFTHFAKTTRVHPLDQLCSELGIRHQLIRPRTPRHNGKVERSHRNDQERFYNYMHFYSYDDLLQQMKRYLKRSNNIPMQVLGWKTPLEKRAELEKIF